MFPFIKKAFQKRKVNLKRGFSLVELLVVIAIFVTITSVVLIRQNRFSSDIAITNLAYQIGLSIRQAQVYGLSVRTSETNCATCFDTGYGIHLDAADKNTYTFFGDNDGDFKFDEKNDRAISRKVLSPDTLISNACAVSGGDNYCFDSGITQDGVTLSPLTSLDILYKRPSPDAIITGTNSAGDMSNISRVYIAVSTIRGDRTKCINIYQNGQISVAEPAAKSGLCE